MARRPAETILLLTADQTTRADFGAGAATADGPPLLSARRQGGAAADDPAARVDTALSLGGAAGRNVWVLWDGAWTQTLSMPAAALAGLDDEQLRRALAYEAEPLSAISADTGALGCLAIPDASGSGRAAYWLTQVPGPARDAIAAAVAKHGSRLAGILHPGGLPRVGWGSMSQGSGGAAGPAVRLELWGLTTVRVDFSGGAQTGGGQAVAPRMHVVHARVGSPGWRGELLAAGPMPSRMDWLGAGAPPELVLDEAVDAPHGMPVGVEWTATDFGPEDAPAAFLQAWAGVLTAPRPTGAAPVPVILPAVAKGGLGLPLIVGAGALAAVLALVAVDMSSLQSVKAAAEADLEKIVRSAPGAPRPADSAAAKAAARKFEAESVDLKAELENLRREEAALSADLVWWRGRAERELQRRAGHDKLLAAQRASLPALLAALQAAEKAESAGEVFVGDVRREPDGDLRINGLCARTRHADKLAESLAGQLGPVGWRVGPAQKRLRDDRAAFEFWIILSPPAKVLTVPAGPAEPGTPAAPAGPADPARPMPGSGSGAGEPPVPPAAPVIPGRPLPPPAPQQADAAPAVPDLPTKTGRA